MNFASDNWAGATPAVLEALVRANAGGPAAAYGGDDVTARVHRTFCDIFEREVEIHLMGTGTATNIVSMAACARPAGFVLCSECAHVMTDEFNGTEAATGMKLSPVGAPDGRITPATFESALKRLPHASHRGPLVAFSMTNSTEYGTVYSPADTSALAAIAHSHGMVVHLDGARFANAVAASGASPADLTWRAGVDLMGFGGTKNGCLAAEAIVVFEPGRFPDIANLRQRMGHGMSKTRFVAAQYEGYFADGGWLASAAHANAMAARLAAGISRSTQARLPFTGAANELFPIVSKATAARLKAAGAVFHFWQEAGPDDEMIRLVTSLGTTEAEVDRFLAVLG